MISHQYWTTKYALTIGIEFFETDDEPRNGYVYLKRRNDHCRTQYKLGATAFTTLADAISAAEDMRRRKIASLQRSIKKIEAIKFDDQTVKERTS